MMARALIFIVKLAVLVGIALWIADRPGWVTIEWQGYVVETSVALLGLAVLALVVLAALVYRFWRSLVAAPRAFSRWRKARRRERGYQALTQGLVAVAAGDPESARRAARRADALLDEPPLTMLLSAQAAQLSGDERAAERYFQDMLERPDMAFLGVRGLLMQALKGRRYDEALRLARKAHELRPGTPWVLATRYDLEARSGNWTLAETALTDAVRVGAVPAEAGKRHRAALLTEQSVSAEAEGRKDVALTAAQRAHDIDHTFVPAAIRLARLLADGGRPKPAMRTLERSWKANPHPLLAEAYRLLMEPNTDPLARLKRMQGFAAMAPRSGEGNLAVAEAALDARLWGEARKNLLRLVEEDRTSAPAALRRACRMMARLEEAEHGDREAARRWLARAAEAPADPAWTCGACGAQTAEWHGRCGTCGGFDTLEWRAVDGPALLPQAGGHGVPEADTLGPEPRGLLELRPQRTAAG